MSREAMRQAAEAIKRDYGHLLQPSANTGRIHALDAKQLEAARERVTGEVDRAGQMSLLDQR